MDWGSAEYIKRPPPPEGRLHSVREGDVPKVPRRGAFGTHRRVRAR